MSKWIQRMAGLLIIFGSTLPAAGQVKIIDQIVAIVGESTILESDLESQYLQMKAEGRAIPGKNMKCNILEDIMVQKLLLHQARLDSLKIDEGQVERQLDARLQYFIQQIGSKEKLEAYFHKSYLEIKEDFREPMREQMLTQQMQQKIIEDVKMTPREVRAYYRSLPKDSIPEIPEQYEIQQILINPPYSEEAKVAARQKLLELRKRILEGESFKTLAILYSEDPGSARNGGELGYQGKAQLVKNFARVAFSLKKGQVSQIVETPFGYHIIQLIDRKGDQVNVRHILIKPKLSADAIKRANELLDSLAFQIRMDSLSFERAAFLFSEDKNTRTLGGLMINPSTGDTRFTISQMDRKMADVVSRLKPGEISDPFQYVDQTGNVVFKIIKLKSVIPAHKANLSLDYSLLQNMAKSGKQKEVFHEWIRNNLKTTYVRVDGSYRQCHFKFDWVHK